MNFQLPTFSIKIRTPLLSKSCKRLQITPCLGGIIRELYLLHTGNTLQELIPGGIISRILTECMGVEKGCSRTKFLIFSSSLFQYVFVDFLKIKRRFFTVKIYCLLRDKLSKSRVYIDVDGVQSFGLSLPSTAVTQSTLLLRG